MRKKNLSVKVAALAMSGTLAMAPMTVRAGEVAGTPATTSTETTAAANTPAAAPANGTGSTGSGATASAGTVTPAAVSTAAGTATPVTVTESPADPGTTAPNNVNTVVPDDNYQGTKISAEAGAKLGFFTLPLVNVDTTISAKDADEKGDKTIAESNPRVENNELTQLKNKDVVMQGDLSIKKEDSTENLDTTKTAPHDVKKGDSYSLQADLDVSAVNNAINKSAEVIPNAKDIWVNNLETGLRATFKMAANLDGSFHVPSDLEDAKKHYELSSADGNPLIHPLIYRINYANSDFKKDKVTIAMDLDLTQMGPLDNQYSSPGADYKKLYGTDPNTGKANHIENFNHTRVDEDGNKVVDYDTVKHEYQTSTLGNLKELINNSAQKIKLIIKGVKFNSASENAEVTETATEKTTTTEGTIRGTLVGYMKADVGQNRIKGKVSFKWGAIQNEEGRDFVAGRDRVSNNKNDNYGVDLTVKMTTTENKVQPVNPGNGGNGGNGGGDRTPIIPTVTPVVTPNENTPADPGQVLGVDRPVSVENAVSVEEKKGEVLGATRPSGKAVATRATVSTGDNHYSALWASLFGLSLASLAGFVVLRKKEQI